MLVQGIGFIQIPYESLQEIIHGLHSFQPGDSVSCINKDAELDFRRDISGKEWKSVVRIRCVLNTCSGTLSVLSLLRGD